jgi:hypothetical protein
MRACARACVCARQATSAPSRAPSRTRSRPKSSQPSTRLIGTATVSLVRIIIDTQMDSITMHALSHLTHLMLTSPNQPHLCQLWCYLWFTLLLRVE